MIAALPSALSCCAASQLDKHPETRSAGAGAIQLLTDAVVEVYSERADDLVVVHLDGIPPGRWVCQAHDRNEWDVDRHGSPLAA